MVDRQVVFLDFGNLPSGHELTMLFFTRSSYADNVTQTPIANHATEWEESGHPRAGSVIGQQPQAGLAEANQGLTSCRPALSRESSMALLGAPGQRFVAAALLIGRTDMAHTAMARIGIPQLATSLTGSEGAPFA